MTISKFEYYWLYGKLIFFMLLSAFAFSLQVGDCGGLRW